MVDSAQEELVGLIFGENQPDGWRDMPEFQIYLSELGQLNSYVTNAFLKRFVSRSADT